MLRKNDEHIRPAIVDYHDLEVMFDVSLEEPHVQISDQREQVLRGKVIPLVKVHRTHRGDEEVIWEHKDLIQE